VAVIRFLPGGVVREGGNELFLHKSLIELGLRKFVSAPLTHPLRSGRSGGKQLTALRDQTRERKARAVICSIFIIIVMIVK
jgi:hypothetical protein